MDGPTTIASLALSQFSFPRTGKRGVPQQFPRRLFEMLETEAYHLEASAEHPRIISWSDSGRAFRIYDVSEFSASILPKYFRTKKFSSFQRNLNLYGFTKVRRGPETDMYAHPSFARANPETLLGLRKITSSTRKRVEVSSADSVGSQPPTTGSTCRAVSPSTPSTVSESPEDSPTAARPHLISNIPKAATDLWPPVTPFQLTKQLEYHCPPSPAHHFIPTNSNDRGKLDLLALAMERTSALSSM